MNVKDPLISVIIPTYNRGHLINRAIQSILNQSYKDFEIIVVDDGSIDNTKEVIESFRDERIRYIHYKENKGANAARNIGIRAAKGDYIAFQDSDDEWLPQKLEKQIKILKDAPSDVGLVYTSFWRIMNDRRLYIPPKEIKPKEGYIHINLLKGNFISTQTMLLRKECFEKAGMFDENLPRLQDWDMVIRLSKHYLIRIIDMPMVNSYYTSESISENSSSLVRAYKMILSKYRDDFENNNLVSKYYYFLGHLLCRDNNFNEGNKYFLEAYKQNLLNIKILFFILILKIDTGLYAHSVKACKYLAKIFYR